MEFQDRKAIYLQLADHLCLDILQDVYKADERIPSVRDYAAEMEVNANTAVRTYEWLQNKNIIYTKRGLGYFVAPEAKKIITATRKEEFKNEHLPLLFRNMRALGITIDEVTDAWNRQ